MSAPPDQTAPRTAGDTSAPSGSAAVADLPSFDELLSEAQRHRASDLLLVAGAPPTLSMEGRWESLDLAPLTAQQIADCVTPILSPEQLDKLHRVRDIDFGHVLPGVGRYRINVHYQQGGLAVAVRMIPQIVPAFEGLGLPTEVLSFADFPSGLVIVAGGTGEGKSTTLAAIVDHMNRTRSSHIITIEDPVEFGFTHGTCLIEQRQIGDDSPSFGSALRHVLRQRPDVILIGEMRDTETVSTALTAAETGHLVLATLHTASAAQTIARIIDAFPGAQQPQIRTQLAGSLRAILCQSLARDELNDRRVPVTELLFATPAIRRAIRDNETHLIYSMIETGRRQGMHTLEQALEQLVKAGRVTAEQAIAVAANPVHMRTMLGDYAGTTVEELRLEAALAAGRTV